MNIAIFLSYPKPCYRRQHEFISKLCEYLGGRGFVPRTLGVTDYDMDAPLKAVRRLMLESNGLITVAFRRTFIEKATVRFQADMPKSEPHLIHERWLTSPWAHIEPAMAYQLGLPILLLRENGVIDDGILEKGVAGLYMPEFDLSNSANTFFESTEWHGIIGQWEGYVRTVVEKKGTPPLLF